jgi:hypothetical protein
MTVEDLRDALRTRNLKVSGRKEELIERLKVRARRAVSPPLPIRLGGVY